MTTDETFTQQCLRAAQGDVELCWEDYIDLVNKRQAGGKSGAGNDAGGGEDMRNARASLVTALAIERAALGALVGDDELDGLDDDEDDDDA